MNKNKNFFLVIVLLLAIAITYFVSNKKKLPEVPVTPEVSGPITHYSCRDGSIDAIFGESSVTLTLSDSRKISLPQVVSGSGMRYEQGDYVFIGKGDDAFFQEKGVITYEDCVANSANNTDTGGETTFVDQGKTISFNYPKSFVLSGGKLGYTQNWRFNTETLGLIIAKVVIPRETQPQTNFSEGTFTLGTSSDKTAIKKCLTPT